MPARPGRRQCDSHPGAGNVPSALRIATWATASGKNQHYSQRYEPSWPRYRANGAVDDEQSEAEKDGDEG